MAAASRAIRFRFGRRDRESNAADVQPVATLGEEAYWDKYLRALRIVKGRYELDLELDAEAGGLDAAKALAVKALSRLPE
jgi:hypothetical protein